MSSQNKTQNSKNRTGICRSERSWVSRLRAYRALGLLLPVLAFGVRPKNKVEFGGGAGFSDKEWVSTSCTDEETRHAEKAIPFGFTLAYERELWRNILSLRAGAGVHFIRFKEWEERTTEWSLEQEGYMQVYTGVLRMDANFRYAGVGVGLRGFFNAGLFRPLSTTIPNLNEFFYVFPTGFVRLGPRLVHFIMAFNDEPHLFEAVAPFPVPLSVGVGTQTLDWYASTKLSWLGLLKIELGYKFLPQWWIGGEFAGYPGRGGDHKGFAGRVLVKMEF